MRLRPSSFAFATAAFFMLGLTTGCGEPTAGTGAGHEPTVVEDTSPTRKTSAQRDRPKASSRIAGDPQIRNAMRCWGLTSGSYFLHLASPETAGDLPKAAAEDYGAWANQGATMIKARGGTLDDYNALKREHQTNLVRTREREAAVSPLRTCIETAPRHMLNVEQPILTGPA